MKWDGGSIRQGRVNAVGMTFSLHENAQVRQLLSRSAAGSVVATCRNPDSAECLQALREQYPGRLSILPLDVTVESSIEVCSHWTDLEIFFPPTTFFRPLRCYCMTSWTRDSKDLAIWVRLVASSWSVEIKKKII